MTKSARKRAPQPSALDSVRVAVEAIEGRKGQDIVVLDVRDVNDATDFFVIASGTSDTHVRGLADAVLKSLQESRLRAHHVEGLSSGRWALLDYVEFVVHLFHPETREFYQLERLWNDAPEVTLL